MFPHGFVQHNGNAMADSTPERGASRTGPCGVLQGKFHRGFCSGRLVMYGTMRRSTRFHRATHASLSSSPRVRAPPSSSPSQRLREFQLAFSGYCHPGRLHPRVWASFRMRGCRSVKLGGPDSIPRPLSLIPTVLTNRYGPNIHMLELDSADTFCRYVRGSCVNAVGCLGLVGWKLSVDTRRSCEDKDLSSPTLIGRKGTARQALLGRPLSVHWASQSVL